MRVQLLQDWPITGGWTIPEGTILDGPEWNGVALPLPFPITCRPLDQAAADHLWQTYAPIERAHHLDLGDFTPTGT